MNKRIMNSNQNCWSPNTYPSPTPEIRKVKKTTRTIEQYDASGNFIGREVITEEESYEDRQILNSPTYSDDDKIYWSIS